MSFSCETHGWRHAQSRCPSCPTKEELLGESSDLARLATWKSNTGDLYFRYCTKKELDLMDECAALERQINRAERKVFWATVCQGTVGVFMGTMLVINLKAHAYFWATLDAATLALNLYSVGMWVFKWRKQ